MYREEQLDLNKILKNYNKYYIKIRKMTKKAQI